MAEENIFAFDTTPFMRGLKKIGGGIAGFQKGIGNMAKNVSRGVMSAVAKIGLIAAAFKGVKAAIGEMPEIGKTFQIAKRIIMKNLLFPLRKAIFPLLQKFLNWVRDNRAMFVKWGQTLANIFQSVVAGVKKIIEIGSKLAGAFRDFINKTFGLQIKTFENLINVLTFKIAVVLEFLKGLIEPIFKLFSKVADIVGTLIAGAFETLMAFVDGFLKGLGDITSVVESILDTILQIVENLFTANEAGHSIQTVFAAIGELFGEIINFVAQIVDAFLKGLMPAIENIMTPIQRIVDAFANIFESIFGGTEQLGVWKDIFGFLGEVVGTVLVTAFEVIATVLEVIATVIGAIVDAIRWVVENIGSVVEAVGGFFGDIGAGIGEALGLAPAPAQDDVIITKKGQIVPVSPEDNILAAKNLGAYGEAGGGGSEYNISIDFKGMQIIIAQATPDEAQRFGENIVDIIRKQLTTELERAGA